MCTFVWRNCITENSFCLVLTFSYWASTEWGEGRGGVSKWNHTIWGPICHSSCDTIKIPRSLHWFCSPSPSIIQGYVKYSLIGLITIINQSFIHKNLLTEIFFSGDDFGLFYWLSSLCAKFWLPKIHLSYKSHNMYY